MKKVIVFDFDGVLVNSLALAVQYMRETFPGITDEEFNQLHYGNIVEEIEKIKAKRRQEPEEEAQRRKEFYTQQKAVAAFYPGVKEMITVLAREYQLVINTSASDDNCLPLLKRDGTDQLFAFIATKNYGASKSDKFKLIASELGVSLADLIFVTDTVGDLKEASKVGVSTIAVTWGIHQRPDFINEGLDNLIAVVDTIEELGKTIKART